MRCDIGPWSPRQCGNPSNMHLDRTVSATFNPCCVWFTGLSGAGKTTISLALATELRARGMPSFILDGDNLRSGLNRDLGFSPEDRTENIRRIAEVARLFVDAGMIVLVAAISPIAADRASARRSFADGTFVEVHVDTPLTVCEQRDPKGLYKKARGGALTQFTGLSAPYEPPVSPELRVGREQAAIDAEVAVVLHYLQGQKLVAT